MPSLDIGTGNGASEDNSHQEHLDSGILQEIAKEVIRSTNLTLRVVTIVAQLASRLDALEQRSSQHSEREPVPEDFGIEVDEVEPQGSAETLREIDLGQVRNEVAEDSTSPVADLGTARAQQTNSLVSINIEQGQLYDALTAVRKALPRGRAAGHLTCIRLEAAGNGLVVSASNGEMTIQRTLRAEVNGIGVGHVDGRAFADAIKPLPRSTIELVVDDQQLHISAGNSSAALPLQDVEEFPIIPEQLEVFIGAVSSKQLKLMLRTTVFAAVKESSTGSFHYTNGVFFCFKDNRLDLVATDGHRLALHRLNSIGSKDGEHELLVPASACGHLEKLVPDSTDTAIRVFQQDEQAIFDIPAHVTGKRVLKHVGRTVMSCKLIDVKYPDYERILPSKFNSEVQVSIEPLAAALKQVLVVYGRNSNPVVQLEAKGGELTVSAEPPESGKVEARLPCDGGNFSVALNPAYMLDVLRVLIGDVVIHWQSETEPLVITSPDAGDFTYVQMAIRMD